MKGPLSALLMAVAVFPAAAWAQSPTPQSQGPLTIERIDSPFVVAADYKATEIDGDIGHMAGISAGRAIDNTLFVGGAAYWLPDGPDGSSLTYGGLLVGWSSSADRKIRFGGRGLLGVGTAELGRDFSPLAPQLLGRGSVRPAIFPTPVPRTFRIFARDDFFVFEPQLTLSTRVIGRFGVDVSAGYRLAGMTDVLDDRLDGATGNIGLNWTF